MMSMDSTLHDLAPPQSQRPSESDKPFSTTPAIATSETTLAVTAAWPPMAAALADAAVCLCDLQGEVFLPSSAFPQHHLPATEFRSNPAAEREQSGRSVWGHECSEDLDEVAVIESPHYAASCERKVLAAVPGKTITSTATTITAGTSTRNDCGHVMVGAEAFLAETLGAAEGASPPWLSALRQRAGSRQPRADVHGRRWRKGVPQRMSVCMGWERNEATMGCDNVITTNHTSTTIKNNSIFYEEQELPHSGRTAARPHLRDTEDAASAEHCALDGIGQRAADGDAAAGKEAAAERDAEARGEAAAGGVPLGKTLWVGEALGHAAAGWGGKAAARAGRSGRRGGIDGALARLKEAGGEAVEEGRCCSDEVQKEGQNERRGGKERQADGSRGAAVCIENLRGRVTCVDPQAGRAAEDAQCADGAGGGAEGEAGAAAAEAEVAEAGVAEVEHCAGDAGSKRVAESGEERNGKRGERVAAAETGDLEAEAEAEAVANLAGDASSGKRGERVAAAKPAAKRAKKQAVSDGKEAGSAGGAVVLDGPDRTTEQRQVSGVERNGMERSGADGAGGGGGDGAGCASSDGHGTWIEMQEERATCEGKAQQAERGNDEAGCKDGGQEAEHRDKAQQGDSKEEAACQPAMECKQEAQQCTEQEEEQCKKERQGRQEEQGKLGGQWEWEDEWLTGLRPQGKGTGLVGEDRNAGFKNAGVTREVGEMEVRKRERDGCRDGVGREENGGREEKRRANEDSSSAGSGGSGSESGRGSASGSDSECSSESRSDSRSESRSESGSESGSASRSDSGSESRSESGSESASDSETAVQVRERGGSSLFKSTTGLDHSTKPPMVPVPPVPPTPAAPPLPPVTKPLPTPSHRSHRSPSCPLPRFPSHAPPPPPSSSSPHWVPSSPSPPLPIRAHPSPSLSPRPHSPSSPHHSPPSASPAPLASPIPRAAMSGGDRAKMRGGEGKIWGEEAGQRGRGRGKARGGALRGMRRSDGAGVMIRGGPGRKTEEVMEEGAKGFTKEDGGKRAVDLTRVAERQREGNVSTHATGREDGVGGGRAGWGGGGGAVGGGGALGIGGEGDRGEQQEQEGRSRAHQPARRQAAVVFTATKTTVVLGEGLDEAQRQAAFTGAIQLLGHHQANRLKQRGYGGRGSGRGKGRGRGRGGRRGARGGGGERVGGGEEREAGGGGGETGEGADPFAYEVVWEEASSGGGSEGGGGGHGGEVWGRGQGGAGGAGDTGDARYEVSRVRGGQQFTVTDRQTGDRVAFAFDAPEETAAALASVHVLVAFIEAEEERLRWQAFKAQ
ncbi:unnamed protein product [Closterium sp. Naga37s-1]|nr:unnamed protein product [Closterium sp. Naga37s-1]